MTKKVITIEGLSKKYKIGSRKSLTLRDSLANLWKKEHQSIDFWALKDVSFEVEEGEAIGIIGRNGAGKSTLLKLLSRITEPTAGKAIMYGRVASLLEVGTGFHGELTGRENIYLNGSLLGMARHEIKSKIDEIIEFSGVEKFIDTPVKHFSSGMYVRLAFSVAAHLNTEILLVDEVLAVGDAEFQQKCLGKMDDVVHSGKTLLFVSHDMRAVEQLCNRSILFEDGVVSQMGNTNEITNSYLNNVPISTSKTIVNDNLQIIFNNDSLKWDEENPKRIEFLINAIIPLRWNDTIIHLGIDNSRGKRIGIITNEVSDQDIANETKSSNIVIEVSSWPFKKGTYYLTLWIANKHKVLFHSENIASINYNQKRAFINTHDFDIDLNYKFYRLDN